MIKYIVCILMAFVASNSVNSQDVTEVQEQEVAELQVEQNTQIQRGPGQIQIHQNPGIVRLDSLKRKNPTKIQGYRVQIFFGDRNKAQEMRAEFMADHPDVPAYISYLAPNFRLRVGDFRTRMASEKFKLDIHGDYPGSYIVKDAIELPELRPEEDQE